MQSAMLALKLLNSHHILLTYFHLFLRLKKQTRGTKEDDDAVMTAIEEFFENQDHHFSRKELEKRYSKCIDLKIK